MSDPWRIQVIFFKSMMYIHELVLRMMYLPNIILNVRLYLIGGVGR